MELTEVLPHLNTSVSGYMLNVSLGKDHHIIVESLLEKLKDAFPGVLQTFPVETLHITLLDWVAPLVDYGRDHDELYREHFELYDKTMRDICSEMKSFTIHFDEIRASKGAIFMTAKDDGSFAHIRDEFVKRAGLISGTKQPPRIIHSSIARYRQEISLESVQEFVGTLSVDFEQEITSFRLVHEKVSPQLQFSTIKTYSLSA